MEIVIRLSLLFLVTQTFFLTSHDQSKVSSTIIKGKVTFKLNLTLFSLKHRHPNGTSTFKLESTLSDLHQLVHPDIQPQDLDLKTGYPPRSINLTSVPPTTTLNSPPFSLSKGEQILLAKKSGSSRSQSSSDNNNGTSNSTQQPIKSSTTSNGTHPTTSSTTNSKAPSKISKGSTPKDGEVFVEVDGSFLTLKVVPDDNSCMFNSVNFAFEQKIGTEACLKLRKGECLCLPRKPPLFSRSTAF